MYGAVEECLQAIELETCLQVYPKKDIRNIVESNKYYRIDNWCKVGQNKCKSKHYVKPFRCLEGVFQSDALLVPEHCVFDHIHNQSVCQGSQYWNRTAISSCSTRTMKLQSYAMLLPCGVGIFSGVEFVCCPHTSSHPTHPVNGKGTEYWKKVTAQTEDGSTLEETNRFSGPKGSKIRSTNSDSDSVEENSNGNDANEANGTDDDYYDDEDYEEEEEEEAAKRSIASSTTTTTTTTTTTESPVKFYLSHFNSQKEHDSFKDAQKSLEDDHKTKVTKVFTLTFGFTRVSNI